MGPALSMSRPLMVSMTSRSGKRTDSRSFMGSGLMGTSLMPSPRWRANFLKRRTPTLFVFWQTARYCLEMSNTRTTILLDGEPATRSSITRKTHGISARPPFAIAWLRSIKPSTGCPNLFVTAALEIGWKITSTGRYPVSAFGERRYPFGLTVTVTTFVSAHSQNSKPCVAPRSLRLISIDRPSTRLSLRIRKMAAPTDGSRKSSTAGSIRAPCPTHNGTIRLKTSKRLSSISPPTIFVKPSIKQEAGFIACTLLRRWCPIALPIEIASASVTSWIKTAKRCRSRSGISLIPTTFSIISEPTPCAGISSPDWRLKVKNAFQSILFAKSPAHSSTPFGIVTPFLPCMRPSTTLI